MRLTRADGQPHGLLDQQYARLVSNTFTFADGTSPGVTSQTLMWLHDQWRTTVISTTVSSAMEPAAMEPAADADNTLRVGDMVYFVSGRFVAGSLEAARYPFIISIGADGDVLVNKFDEVLMPDQLIRRVQRGHLPLHGKWQPHTEGMTWCMLCSERDAVSLGTSSLPTE